MSRNTTIGIAVVVIVAVGGYFLFKGERAIAPSASETVSSGSAMPVPGTDTTETIVEPIGKKSAAIITFTDKGYTPTPVTVKVGDMVTFKNESSVDFWPASAMHPTHTVYPGSDIKKCGTAAESSIFDACRGIKPGAEWSFTFTQVGTWNYHDHLSPKYFGRIIVQ